ncbi:flagellar biosynthesis protein FliQ [Parvibium lacunae]|uniref:Flagellar biosynthetic protein FliQ n=1 Tax=Parvibium lacunae TaxID=1888893 RepID=A0A368L533_9BURK|nr:flagellar biosynthesis protein FliQ [Parvibium lacunae]RCS58694.1 flagellar biosynthetic protein FliQ [Parvibium lacunae]
MNTQAVLSMGQQGLEVMLLVSAPILLTALAVGLIISIFQAATQINEVTLSFVPKIIAIFVVMIITGPWMLTTMIDYIQRLFGQIPFMIG